MNQTAIGTDPSKTNILILVRGMDGVNYHRLLIPHYYINSHYKDEFSVSQINEIDSATDDFLKNFQIVIFNRFASIAPGHDEPHRKLLERLRKLGIKSVMDIDDFWEVDRNHILWEHYQKENISKHQVEGLINADAVFCPTEILASQIMKLNKRVAVIENAIDPAQPQFEIEDHPCDKMRFGWIGGVSHYWDMDMIKSGFEKLNTTPFTKDKYQLFLMGFNEADQSGVYPAIEKMMTKGIALNTDIYYRINAANVYTYANGYNLFDVALAPLETTVFNSCKSELKLCEAGFMKKAVICSDTMPYSLIAKNGVNCISIMNSPACGNAWYLAFKRFIKEPNLKEDLAEALYETVSVRHHIKPVTEKRVQIYRHLVK